MLVVGYTVGTASDLARKKPLSITRHQAMTNNLNPHGEVAVPKDRNNDKKRGQQTRRVNLTVPAELLEQARRTARSLGLSLSAYVSLTLARHGDR